MNKPKMTTPTGTCEYCRKRCACRVISGGKERFNSHSPAVQSALREAITAIYLHGPLKGEFGSALWRVVRELDPDLSGVLEYQVREAYEIVKEDEGE